MTKFDLKKIIAENKATFFSSLDEGYDEFKRVEKGSKDVTAKDKGEEDVYGAGVKKGEEIEKKKLSEVSMSKEKIAKKIVNYFEIKPESLEKFKEFKLDGTDDIKKLTNFVVSNSKPFPGKPLTLDQIQNTIEGFIKQATSTEPSSDVVYPQGSRMDEEKTTMTKEALKTKIKEMILAELNEENIDVTNLDYDFLPEAKKEDEEATDAPEATDIEFSAEETPTSDSFEVSTSEVDPTVKAIQDALTQAQAAAQKLGDEKLTDQIGNTITFFTRTHVANKDVTPVAEQLDEAFINKLKHRAGIIK